MHVHNVKESIKRNLLISIGLNTIIVLGQIVGGIISNSLALISDALHNFGDLLALILALAANQLSTRKADNKRTYGFIRVEIIAAFVNSSFLLAIGVYIIYEGVLRIISPEPLLANWLILFASIGFVANAFSSYLLHKDSMHDLNAKASYLHLFYDAVHSLGVIVIGIIISYTNLFMLDGLASIVIGVFILHGAWKVATESASILNENTPSSIDINEIEKLICNVEGVLHVHHIHVWKISSSMIALSAHVVVEDRLLSEAYLIVDKIEKELYSKFKINHPTIQLEAHLPEVNEKIEIKNYFK